MAPPNLVGSSTKAVGMAEPPPSKPKFPLRMFAYITDVEGKEVCLFKKEIMVEDSYYFSLQEYKVRFLDELKMNVRVEMTIVLPGKDDIS